MMMTPLAVPLQRNNDNPWEGSALFKQSGHRVVPLLLHIAKDAHGYISTAAQCDTGLPQSNQKEVRLLNLTE